MWHRSSLWLALLLGACAQAPSQMPTVSQCPTAVCPCDCKDKVSTGTVWPERPIPDSATDSSLPPKPATSGNTNTPPLYSTLQPISWEAFPGWGKDPLTEAWPAWLEGCKALRLKAVWRTVCEAADQLNQESAAEKLPNPQAIDRFFKQHFQPYQATNPDGTDTGLVTGYYEPTINGSRSKSSRYRYPIYLRPNDLVTVELASLYPELAHKRLRGRVVGQQLLPYYPRAEIESESAPLAGQELLWADDILDVFFLQIQGSGMVRLDSGEAVHIGYADQNGQPYQSIGRLLIERGELTADKASMQGIKNWAKSHPEQLRKLLDSNPSYVFFRELPAGLPGPYGALGVPILAQRVVAVDPRYVPLGSPIFLATTYPNSNRPLERLMMAQDTGGAIKGGVRADFFWGAGDEAARQAGSMKQKGKIWVLLPKNFFDKTQ